MPNFNEKNFAGDSLLVGHIRDLQGVSSLQTQLIRGRVLMQRYQVNIEEILAELEDIFSDLVVTPDEKEIIKREWTQIISFHSVLYSQVASLGVLENVVWTSYEAAYDALEYVLNTDPGILNEMAEATELTATLFTYFEDLYNTRGTLSDSIDTLRRLINEEVEKRTQSGCAIKKNYDAYDNESNGRIYIHGFTYEPPSSGFEPGPRVPDDIPGYIYHGPDRITINNMAIDPVIPSPGEEDIVTFRGYIGLQDNGDVYAVKYNYGNNTFTVHNPTGGNHGDTLTHNWLIVGRLITYQDEHEDIYVDEAYMYSSATVLTKAIDEHFAELFFNMPEDAPTDAVANMMLNTGTTWVRRMAINTAFIQTLIADEAFITTLTSDEAFIDAIESAEITIQQQGHIKSSNYDEETGEGFYIGGGGNVVFQEGEWKGNIASGVLETQEAFEYDLDSEDANADAYDLLVGTPGNGTFRTPGLLTYEYHDGYHSQSSLSNSPWVVVLRESDGRLLGVGFGSSIAYSDDDGDSWTEYTLGTATWRAAAVLANGSFIIGNEDGYYTISTSGEEGTWNDLTFLDEFENGIWVLWVKKHNPEVGRVIAGGAMYRKLSYSDDNGSTWAEPYPIFGDTENYIRCFAESDEGTLVCGDSNRRLHRSTDGGVTFSLIIAGGTNIDGTNINSGIAYGTTFVFVGEGGKLFWSINDGENFVQRVLISYSLFKSRRLETVCVDGNGYFFFHGVDSSSGYSSNANWWWRGSAYAPTSTRVWCTVKNALGEVLVFVSGGGRYKHKMASNTIAVNHIHINHLTSGNNATTYELRFNTVVNISPGPGNELALPVHMNNPNKIKFTFQGELLDLLEIKKDISLIGDEVPVNINGDGGTIYNMQLPVCHIIELGGYNTDAGTLTGDQINWRDFNYCVANTIPNVIFDPSQPYGWFVYVPPGNYYVHATIPAYRVGRHQVLLNIHSSAPNLLGTSAHSHTTYGSVTCSIISEKWHVPEEEGGWVRITHYCESTKEDNGRGLGSPPQSYSGRQRDSIYGVLKIWQI